MRKRKKKKRTSPRGPPRGLLADQRLRGNRQQGCSSPPSPSRQPGLGGLCTDVLAPQQELFLLAVPAAESTCSQPSAPSVLGGLVLRLKPLRGSASLLGCR